MFFPVRACCQALHADLAQHSRVHGKADSSCCVLLLGTQLEVSKAENKPAARLCMLLRQGPFHERLGAPWHMSGACRSSCCVAVLEGSREHMGELM